jgi:hypothetical protein
MKRAASLPSGELRALKAFAGFSAPFLLSNGHLPGSLFCTPGGRRRDVSDRQFPCGGQLREAPGPRGADVKPAHDVGDFRFCNDLRAGQVRRRRLLL